MNQVLSTTTPEEVYSVGLSGVGQIKKLSLDPNSELAKVNSDLEQEVTNLGESLEVGRGLASTRVVNNFDTKRDNTTKALTKGVEALTYVNNPEISGAASDVYEVINSVGRRIYKLSYEEQSAVNRTLISKLKEPTVKSKLTKLNMFLYVEELEQDENNFQEAFNNHSELKIDVKKVIPEREQARVVRQILNTKLLPLLNILASYSSEVYGSTLNSINGLVDSINTKSRTRLTTRANAAAEN